MLGHLFFTCPTQRSARLLASYSASSSSISTSSRRGRIYNYVFKVRSPDSYLGSFHASELPFVFGTTPGGILFPSSFTLGEELVSQAMIHAWTSFVATGVPTFPERPEIPVRKWPEFTLKEEEVVEFLNDGEVKVAGRPLLLFLSTLLRA
jgi:carboxylesterase type B